MTSTPSSETAAVGGQILEWIAAQNRPVLYSEIEAHFGAEAWSPFDDLIRGEGPLMAVFPEAKPGDSGRQFWDFRWMGASA